MTPKLVLAQDVGRFTLPEGHLFGMAVPKGGSACSKCKFLSEDGRHCGSTYFQDWQKSLGIEDPTLIPNPADEYCCDVFAAKEKEPVTAAGRNIFYDYADNRERDGIVSSILHVGYIKKEKGEYCVHSEKNPDWSGGCYPSKEKAEERLRQVEFFKHKGASDLAIRVAFRFLAEMKASPLERLTKDSWYMPVSKDRFVHFTTEARAEQILKSGKLLMRPPHEKFGTDTVDAVSLTFGKLVPGVQFTHYQRSAPNEKLVGIVFQTDTMPKVGYREEVKWGQDVHLKSPSIVSFGQAQSLIRGASEQIDESDYVVYQKP